MREWVPNRHRPRPGSARGQRGTPGPASSGYLVVVQPRLQDLIQLPRQRVAGLRRDPACSIADAVGSPGRGYRHYFPAALGHSVAGPAPSSVAATSALGWDPRHLREYCACAQPVAHAPRVPEGSARTAQLSQVAGRGGELKKLGVSGWIVMVGRGDWWEFSRNGLKF